MEQIKLQVESLIAEKLGIKLTNDKWDADFTNDLNVDSLDVYELFVEAEKIFAIIIPDEQAEKISTPAELTDYIISQKK